MRRDRAWKLGATGIILASTGAVSLAVFVGGAVSSASPRDNGGAPLRGAPGGGPGGESVPGQSGAATLTLSSSTNAPSTSTTIDLSSYDFSQSNSLNIGSQSSGAGAGKVTFSPLIVTTPLGAQTTAAIANSSGHFDKADLVVHGPGGRTVLDATFGPLVLKQYEISSASRGTVTLTFEYGALKLAAEGASTTTS